VFCTLRTGGVTAPCNLPAAQKDADAVSAGHWNHSFWWRQLAPAGSKETNYEKSASPQLKEAIEDRFGSLNKLRQACMPGFELPQGPLLTARNCNDLRPNTRTLPLGMIVCGC
jgi:hypothetical protein